ncbi:hypothetical protein DHEL01_v207152 [Diaporthe helianthi]|uniref:EKC/KEOPS complex subunit BUD32 n=1 Tax=Diaporthe helianthi TaxID=158607 RepID=A0A2P5HW16_DIAHE|nr:hypothetical protein DHEL01_v207152 [Diaporthe helianthi]
MGYFDDCSSEDRFMIRQKYFDKCVVSDWDERRIVAVVTPGIESDDDFIIETLARHIDSVPADALAIEVSSDGELVSFSSDVADDWTMAPFYPSTSDFPPGTETVRREDLTEISRLGVQTDLCEYNTTDGKTHRVAFKYYTNENQVPIFWHELNCVLKIPKHPNIVPFDRLVIDKLDGEDKVVGFTAPFVEGGTVDESPSRVFKLKYLQQLLNCIDYLNLQFGIVHGDVCGRNLLINDQTDNVQLFDFNMAAKLGWEGDSSEHGNAAFAFDEDRNDVKCVVFTLYEIITHDLHLREEYLPNELDISILLDLETWAPHPDVDFDADPAEYRRLLEDWLVVRRDIDKKITHFSKAARALEWPPLPKFERAARMRQELILQGSGDFLKWQRPGSKKLRLTQGQRLLATGEVVNDSPSDAQNNQKRKRGPED